MGKKENMMEKEGEYKEEEKMMGKIRRKRKKIDILFHISFLAKKSKKKKMRK